VTVKVGADGKSIDVDLAYAHRDNVSGISARLNAFRAEPQLYEPASISAASGPPLRVEVSGAPKRVLFDPAWPMRCWPIAAQGMSRWSKPGITCCSSSAFFYRCGGCGRPPGRGGVGVEPGRGDARRRHPTWVSEAAMTLAAMVAAPPS